MEINDYLISTLQQMNYWRIFTANKQKESWCIPIICNNLAQLHKSRQLNKNNTSIPPFYSNVRKLQPLPSGGTQTNISLLIA